MSEDYYDIAWIHGEEKAILYGRRADGSTVERVLTDDERESVFAFESKYSRERYRLMRQLAEDTEIDALLNPSDTGGDAPA